MSCFRGSRSRVTDHKPAPLPVALERSNSGNYEKGKHYGRWSFSMCWWYKKRKTWLFRFWHPIVFSIISQYISTMKHIFWNQTSTLRSLLIFSFYIRYKDIYFLSLVKDCGFKKFTVWWITLISHWNKKKVILRKWNPSIRNNIFF